MLVTIAGRRWTPHEPPGQGCLHKPGDPNNETVTMLVYGCLALCALVLILMVYRYDMYDKEPWYMLVLALVRRTALAVVVVGEDVGERSQIAKRYFGLKARAPEGPQTVTANWRCGQRRR